MVKYLILAALPVLGMAHSPVVKPEGALEPKLMRQERRQSEEEELARDLGMRLAPNGELIQHKEVVGSPVLNYCDYDFIYGTANKTPTTCNDATYDTTIDEENMCSIAAYRHRATVHEIPDTIKESHPKGCFKGDCALLTQYATSMKHLAEAPFLVDDEVTAQYNGAGDRLPAKVTGHYSDGNIAIAWEDATKTDDTNKTASELLHKEEHCFFFNAYGTEPTGPVTGVPVCKRVRYALGTQDTTGDHNGTNAGCKTDFSVIMDEDECAEAAKCQAYCTEEDFLVSATSSALFNNYPLGCFVYNERAGYPAKSKGRCIAFNAPSAIHGDDAIPTSPKGTPVCHTPLHQDS